MIAAGRIVRTKVNSVSGWKTRSHARFAPGDCHLHNPEIQGCAEDAAILAFLIGKNPKAIVPIVVNKTADADDADWKRVRDLPCQTTIWRHVDT